MGVAENIHGCSTSEALNAIGKDFLLLRRLSFANALLHHSSGRQLREAGFVSGRTMGALASFPATENLDEYTAKEWLRGLESIQRSLHDTENAQLDGMAKASLVGIVALFFFSIGLLLSTLGLVSSGYPEWLAVLLFFAVASAYSVVSLRMRSVLEGRARAVFQSLRSTCDKLPTCLWDDIQTAKGVNSL